MASPLSTPEKPTPASSSATPLTSTPTLTFHLFPLLPSELRAQIWEASLIPHIIRWIRTDDKATNTSNTFNSSLRNSPLLNTSHEARETLLLRTHFLPSSPISNKKVYIDPTIDYLHLDLVWSTLNSNGLPNNPLTTLPRDLIPHVKRIMVNPNYTDSRLKPGIPLQNFTGLETMLVVADEKALGAQGKFLQATVYDLQKYYEGINRQQPGIVKKIPSIAIGCLGWVGEEKRKLVHAEEDGRVLVAVFESQVQMKDYLAGMREEEVKFLERGRKTGFKLKFREGMSMEGSTSRARELGRPPGFEERDVRLGGLGTDELPAYEDIVAAHHSGFVVAADVHSSSLG